MAKIEKQPRAKRSQYWGDYLVPGREPTIKDFGPLRLWYKIIQNDFWLARHYFKADEEDLALRQKEPEADSWLRWALPRSFSKLRLRASLPDRPVVVKPEAPFLLSPRAHARVYVRCPLWVRVELVDGSDLFVEDLPTVILSNTWFGTFSEGELCYWVSSSAARETACDPARPFLCICPIDITNKSKDELSVEKICLRVGGLSLFDDGEQLWTDETKISYRGAHTVSQVNASGKAPHEATQAKLVSSPREPASRSFSANTFASLKALPGFGFIPE